MTASRPHRKALAVRRLARPTALSTFFTGFMVLLVAVAPTSQAATDKIEGSGSSWSANAVNQWIADVESSGLEVVFTSQGSAQGRKDFANVTTDYAVSDIGFRGVDPVTGQSDTNEGRAFAYLPIVAGGTSFPYNLSFGGKQITDLRLSGQTLAKIFTSQITRWDDAQITADNNGRKMPPIDIVPLVHAEGSGSTAQLTTYFAKQYPSIWRSCFSSGLFTEYYPKCGGGMIAQNGSDQIINYVTSAAANGVITYDEYSYALAKDFPVVKVQNQAGYFTLPDQYNVAVALTRAKINMDEKSPNYLLQNLEDVFTSNDPRTYPLSSYSYMIIPTGANDRRMSTNKRQALVDFLYYSVCEGQKAMGPIGYSPLPINLVQASFEQTNKLKAADPGVQLDRRDASTCKNPTFVAGEPSRNYLAEIAPNPPDCDRAGAGPCAAGTSEAITENPVNGEVPVGSGGAAGGGGGQVEPGTPQGGGDPGADGEQPGAAGTPEGGAAAGADPSAPGGGAGAGAPGAGSVPTPVPLSVPGVKTTVDAATGAVTTTVIDPGTGKPVAATVDAATGLVVTTFTDPKTGVTSTGVVDAKTGKITKAQVDPTTGQLVAPTGVATVGGGGRSGSAAVGGSGVDSEQIAVPTDLASTSSVSASTIGRLTILLLLLAIMLPPLIARAMTRKRVTS